VRLNIRVWSLPSGELAQRFVVAIVLLLVTALVTFCQIQPQTSREDVPFYAAKAIPIYRSKDKVKTATSPDGKKRVSIEILDDNAEDFPARITVDTDHDQSSATIRFGLATEILWSPDSRAFALTGSSGGSNGQYATDVFYVQEKKLLKVQLTTLVEKAFGHPVRCAWTESLNVAALKWLIPSKELLVAAEIIHHSNCDSFGTFKAYAVDLQVPRVVKVLNQLETKHLYHDDLGEELLQSDDTCIRHPESCHVGSYHQ
jgi:hypothetical protein